MSSLPNRTVPTIVRLRILISKIQVIFSATCWIQTWVWFISKSPAVVPLILVPLELVLASQKFDDPVHPSCKLLLPEARSEKTEGRWDIPYPALSCNENGANSCRFLPKIIEEGRCPQSSGSFVQNGLGLSCFCTIIRTVAAWIDGKCEWFFFASLSYINRFHFTMHLYFVDYSDGSMCLSYKPITESRNRCRRYSEANNHNLHINNQK